MKKKTISLIFKTLVVFALAVLMSSSVGAAFAQRCTLENVEVSDFNGLKNALENYTAGQTITLSGQIDVSSDNADCKIEIDGNGIVTLDLNGYRLNVTSKKTKTLFEVTGAAQVYFVNGKIEKTSSVSFNTVAPSAKLLEIKHKDAEVTDVNVAFAMGGTYKNTTDNSETYVFYAEKARSLSVYGGNFVANSMVNGNCIGASDNSDNENNFKLKIGGGVTVRAYKHCAVFNPEKLSYVRFGSLRFETTGGSFERLLVPASCKTELKDLWDSKDTVTSIYIGGLPTFDYSKTVSELSKKDITVNKNCCDGLNEQATEPFPLLEYAGGHVNLCSICKVGYKNMYFKPHDFIASPGITASCGVPGKESGQKCKVCLYDTGKLIPALSNHELEFVKGEEPTCKEDGERDHYLCKNCKGIYADAEAKELLTANDLIIKTTHNVVFKAEKKPTCTEAGHSYGYLCETCGKTEGMKAVPALGHKETEYQKAVAPTCKTEGSTRGTKCSVCNEILEAPKPIPVLNHKKETIKGYEASCETEGKTDGIKCLECNIMIKEQEVIPPLGHKEEVVPAKKPTCIETGLTEGKRCSVCEKVLIPQEIVAVGPHTPETVKGKEATCIAAGLTDGLKCSVCNLVIEAQKEIPINEKHNEKIIEAKEPTCENSGLSEGIICLWCNKLLKEQSVIPKKNHNEKVIEGFEASCDKDGLSNGIVCTLCEKVLKEQEVIKKLGHNEKILEGIEPTCEKEGLSAGIGCSRCGELLKKQEVLKKTGHSESVTVTRATFDSKGEIVVKCNTCKKTVSEKTIYRIKSVTLSKKVFDYNKKVKTPAVTVKNSKGEVLKNGTDYVLSYSEGRKAIGKYTVKVSFIGAYSGAKTLSFSVIPAKTAELTAARGETTVTLKWKKVLGATSYKVYVYNEKTKKFKTLKEVTGTSYKISSLKAGTTYKFAVKAFSKTKNGTFAGNGYLAIDVTTLLKAPTMKVSLNKTAATISWNEVEGAEGYGVFIKEGKNGKYKRAASTSKLSFKKTKLKKGKTYYIKVRAFKKINGKYICSPFCTYKKITVK